MEKKRKYKRLRYGVNVELSYYQEKPKDSEVVSRLRTENIGAGGIRVRVPYNLDIGTLLSVKLTMPGTGDEISCFAQVAWVSPAQEGAFDAGLAFVNISKEEMVVINRFVEAELDKGIE